MVACNAASSALDRDWAVPVVGIIETGIAQVCRSGHSRVAVWGGRRTILSGAYARPLRSRGIHVVQRVAQPLSALVERGKSSGPQVDAALAKVTRGLGEVSAIVLACTHYAALEPAIRARTPGVALLDPAEALAHVVPGPTGGGPPVLECHTTGPPRSSRRAAQRAFGLDPGRFRSTRL